LRGHAPQEVVLKGWSGGTGGSQWAADGKGWYVTGVTQRGLALLHVDLKGDTHVLWERHGASIIRAVPSPDGRHLAILDETVNGDIWMIAIQDRR